MNMTGIPGFKIGGHHSNEYGLFLIQKQIEIVPESRDIEQVIYGLPGLYDYRTEHAQRMITLTLAFYDETRAKMIQNAHNFAALINPMIGYQPMIFDDEPDKFYSVKYTSSGNGAQYPLMTFDHLVGDIQLGFKCDDPFIYSTSSQDQEWEAPYNGQTTLQNNGSQSCPLLITLRAPGSTGTETEYTGTGVGTTNPGSAGEVTQTAGITLTINGVSVTYAGSIGPSDEVVIDTKKFIVTKNGQNDLANWSGDFPQLDPGINTVAETDTAGAGVDVEFQYTERWL